MLTDVSLKQDGKLAYNGGATLTPTVEAKATSVNSQPVTLKYSTLQDGTYGSLPSFDKAGSYTVYFKAADNAYNALTDYEKSLIDADAKKALDDAKSALAELNKPADTNSPQTGDNSNMFLWIALLFISGGAVITLTIVDRKRRTASKR